MSDGPFRNLKLDRRSKRFAEAVQNDAVDQETRCAFAADAIVNSILNEDQSLLTALASYGLDGQLDFDPRSSILGIFDAHPKSQFSAHLEREVSIRLHNEQKHISAIGEGLRAALESHIDEFRSRTQEAGLDARQNGRMYKDQFDRLIEGSNSALVGLDRTRIIEALCRGNKAEFKQDIRKKQGLDDGPDA